MQGAHQAGALPCSFQTHRQGSSTSQYYGTGKKLHGGGSNFLRIMRIIASRGHSIGAGASTAHGEDDMEPKRSLYRSRNSTTTSRFRLKPNIAERSEVGLKEMFANNDDVLLPHAFAHCEFLQLALSICDEVEAKLELHKSKKPLRLSTTSWDLLD